MFSGVQGLTVEQYHKGHTKFKAPALDTEYTDNAQKTCTKNRTNEAQEIIDTSCNLDLRHTRTAMPGASALDLRMCRIEVRPMSLTLANVHEA